MGSPDSKHWEYETIIDDWLMQRDCEAGERTIKDAGITYLPMPNGFKEQDDKGVEMYSAYRMRAQYPDLVQPTLQGMVGVIHRVEAQIEGMEEGKPLFGMYEKATKDGLTLEMFHRHITTELLLMGRYAVLTDVPSEGGDGIPYFAGYGAEKLINWTDPDRDLFVLDESGKIKSPVDEFAWVDHKQYRVLRLRDGVYSVQVYGDLEQGEEEIQPQLRGGKKLDQIPLVVAGPRELSLELVQPPLLGVSKAALAIYRLDADYRHQLFNSGQETFIVIGEVENLPRVTGSTVIIGLPAGSDAKFVSPSCSGIDAHRQAIQDERQSAVAAGVKLFDTQAKAESGEALRLRAAAQTATLTTIALASAALLEKSLRYAAMFVGQNPDEIVVKPNLQFVDTQLPAADAVQLVSVWQSGAISKLTLYENLQRGEIASAERDFDEEEELIKQEAIDNPANQPMQQGGQPQDMFGGDYQGGQGGGSQGSAAPPRLNGGGELFSGVQRFIETGDGLQVIRE